VHVIPNGVDAARFYKLESQTQKFLARTRLLNSAPILLLPVRVTRRKNIELALYTLSELRKSFPDAALVVTGPLGPHNARNYEYFDELKHLRAELGLQDLVHFLAELADSFLPDEVIADFYRVADALIFPSREEGFGIPLLEAAFSHLPAFCADIPPLRELGMNDTYFFRPMKTLLSLRMPSQITFNLLCPRALPCVPVLRSVGRQSIGNISRLC
jgi:glycosyltransferase involved in cell wall biosynthesis